MKPRIPVLVHCVVAGLLLCGGAALAQGSYGTLTGYVTDEEGGALPGVTLSAESPALLGTRLATSDGKGYYRLINLPPGEYKVTATLEGFTPVIREDIPMRAGATFRADFTLPLGTVREAITVTADAPMLDIDNPGQVLTIDGEFQRAVPVQGRKNWSDFLELTPGVHARPFDDGSGRMVYFGHGTEHFAHVIQLEGQIASTYRDAQATYIQMSTDILADVEVKTSGVEAAAPLGTGLVINMVTRSGGNQFAGSVSHTYQPLDWNGDNTDPGETPTVQRTSQSDFSFGGPISKDRAWFFTAARWAKNESGISRTAREVEILTEWEPNFQPFNNIYEGFFPYAKITAQPGTRHSFAAYYQKDNVDISQDREYNPRRLWVSQTGGNLYGLKMTSVLTANIASEITLSYNDKTSSYQDLAAATQLGLTGPNVNVYEDSRESGGRRVGRGFLLEDGNVGWVTIGPSTMRILRADFIFYKEGWKGSHEFKTGLFYAPKNTRHDTRYYLNDGFVQEDRVAIDPDDLSAGTIPFRRRYFNPTELDRINNEDRDIGVYLQDSWKPTERLSIHGGVRVDFIKRHDKIFNITRMDDTAVGPRFGFSYLLGEGAKNILRGSIGRVHEQVNGRDYATNISAGITVEERNLYDVDLDGVFEVERITPGETPALAALNFADDLQQPYTDELVLGYRRQFGREVALDVAYIHREHKKRYAQVEINGYWPDGPHQPFGGFGRIDPNRGTFYQIANNTWSELIYDAVELTVTKRLSRNWQAMAGFNYQWQKVKGTWNPTDPAGFIQPDAHHNTKCIWMPRGLRDDNSYALGTNSTYCPTWRPYSIRLAATYHAPWGINLSGNFTLQSGPWTGPVLTQIDEYTPELEAIYGPEEVVLENGQTRSNPLATQIRFLYGTRDEGQVRLDDTMYLNIRAGKVFNLGDKFDLELTFNVFNPFNWDDHQQYTYNGANQSFSSNYLQPRNRQLARAYQVLAALRF